MTRTLILVAGLGCTPALFAPQAAALRADGVEVRFADHARDETMAGVAARLLAEAPARFALGGLSMGGYVALEVMRQAPERITGLALLDTGARGERPEIAERRRARAEAIAAGGYAAVVAELWPLLVHPDRLGDAALRETVERMHAAIGPEGFVRQQRAITSRLDQRAMLPGIAVPTLVLVGDADALTPPPLAREMAGMIEGASLAIVPECGHLATLEQPEAVTTALRAWLARTAA